jgi:Fic family protein
MGRMWHSLLLGKWNEIFYWLPIEELIRSRQQEYYDALGKSDRESDSSAFVEYKRKQLDRCPTKISDQDTDQVNDILG